jgi:hypothetical protein
MQLALLLDLWKESDDHFVMADTTERLDVTIVWPSC